MTATSESKSAGADQTAVLPAPPAVPGVTPPLTYGQKVMIAVGVSTAAILLTIFVYVTMDILVLCFAGVLLAVFISAPADLLAKYTRLKRGYALALVLATLTLMVVGGGYFMGWTVYRQTKELERTLGGASAQFIKKLGHLLPAEEPATKPATPAAATQVAGTVPAIIPATLPEAATQETTVVVTTRPDWLTEKVLEVQHAATDYFLSESAVKGAGKVATGVVSSTFGIIGNFVVVFGVGLFFALNPKLYSQGLVKLFPISRRPRAAKIMDQMGTQLEWWFVGQLCSMVSIGFLTFVGLSILGVPMAVTLGILAGLMNFIPNFGPILAAAPAVFVAFAPHGDQTQLNPALAGWVIVLYVIIQLLEGWVITPFFQQRAVELPPALIIVSQVIFGLLLGPLGLVLATPILATVLVLVRMVYIEDILGDHAPASPEK